MSKKGIALSLSLILSCGFVSIPASAGNDFPDVPSHHWAYSSVMTLVDDGTVRGFEDGEFKPDAPVSRAEFVKMIGNGAVRRTASYADVPAGHWAYEPVMHAELGGENGMFRPDEPMLRDDVALLIWLRNNSPKDIVAPSVITKQSQNPQAIAWVYGMGIINGDDGLSLRLAAGLTRAEAAALIVRSRGVASGEKKTFSQTVSPEILKAVFESLRLFDDGAYDPDRTITNGEMARAAQRLGEGSFHLSYTGFSTKAPFSHPYAADLAVLGEQCLGSDAVTQEFIDKKATMRDTLSALVYNAIRNSYSVVSYGKKDSFYQDIPSVTQSMMNVCLTYAYENGVFLFAEPSLKPDKEITLREFAAVLLQLDALLGLNAVLTTDTLNGRPMGANLKLRTDLGSYPSNAGDFAFIARELPNSLYETAFYDGAAGKTPAAFYDFSREFSFVFVDMLRNLKERAEGDSEASVRFTYYPSLVCENNNGATLRVKLEILTNPRGLSLRELFGRHAGFEGQYSAEKGAVYYGDVITGNVIDDISLSVDTVMLRQIIPQ